MFQDVPSCELLEENINIVVYFNNNFAEQDEMKHRLF